MEYYSSLKRSELSNYEKRWKNLKLILLTEISHSEKATHYIIPTIRHSKKDKTTEKIKRISSCQ